MDGQRPKLGPAAHAKSASTDAVFLPRSEFWRAPVTPHSFALVSFNGNEILRLANCPVNVVSAVRRALPEDDIRHFREDPDIVVSEFLLAGKPFSGRSVRQEQLLLNIFTAIMSQNYTLVTSIDYGRIYLDRLTLVFKRAMTPATENQNADRFEPFGISFVSSTALRVVSPPLRFTPAILQVVRSAWPLGVVGEKRESDGSYLFKLKGYSFFKQSTFETDSLAHTLELLRGMDNHGFTMITSMSLAKRARVQDFWIFSAPAPPLPPTTNAGLAAISSLRKAGGSVGGKATASSESNPPPSPVHSHSMLGLGGPDDVPRQRNIKPRSPAPSSGSSEKPMNPAVAAVVGAAGHHERSPSSRHRRDDHHIRSVSLTGSPHVLRKTPPTNLTKPSTPTRDYRTPEPTPRPSPREASRNLQPSPSQRPLMPGTGYQYQHQPYPEQYQQQPGAFTPDPNSQQQQQLPQYHRPPQPYPMVHRPTSDASSQLLYNTSPPPPGEYQPVYNTVPSGIFTLPNIPQSQPQTLGLPQTSLPGISESPTSKPPTLRDLELDDTEHGGDDDDDDDDDENQGLGIGSKLLGSSVFRDTLGTSGFDDDGDGSSGSAGQRHAYPGSVDVADYPGMSENDFRRVMVNEIHSYAGNTPRFVHPDLPEDDPARRSSDEPSFSFVGASPPPPQPFFTDARLPHRGSDPRGANRLEPHYEAPPSRSMGVTDMVKDDDSSMSSPATEGDRPTTRAAAAEVVSYSNSLAKKQSRSLATGTAAAVKPDASSLAIRAVDENTKNGPWVLVSPPEGAAPNGQAPLTQTVQVDVGRSRHRPAQIKQDVPAGEKNKSGLGTTSTPSTRPAAVPVPIPTSTDVAAHQHQVPVPAKSRVGVFPWSKSRREQREREKAQEKEKEKQRQRKSEERVAVPPPPNTTNLQKDSDNTNMESEQPPVGAVTTTKKTSPSSPEPRVPSGAAETAAATSSSDSSSSSVLRTPGGPTESHHQRPPSITESSFTKDIAGRLRKRPHAVTEVGTTEKRLTID